MNNFNKYQFYNFKKVCGTDRIIGNEGNKYNSNQTLNITPNNDNKLKQSLKNQSKLWKIKQPSQKYGDYIYKKRFLIEENNEFDDVHLCKGELQVDIQVLKKCADNLEYSNRNLSQIRPSMVSPFTKYRTPVTVTKFKDLKYTEVVLEQNKMVLNDFDKLFAELSSISSVLAYANIQAISEHLKVLEIEDQQRQSELNQLFKTNKGFNEKITKLESKINQKNQQQYNYQFDDDSQTYFGNQIQENNKQEYCQYQIFVKTLQKHKEESQKQKKLILSQYFGNQCFIYIQKDNARINLKNFTSHYGISQDFEQILFGKNDISHYSLHQGLYHPYHDYYSHLQHFLVHLLNYQDRRVNLRTFDNFILQGYLRRHVFTVKSTKIPQTNLQFTDKIVLHQFIIDQNHLKQLNEMRKKQPQNQQYFINEQYVKAAQYLISKFQLSIDLTRRGKKFSDLNSEDVPHPNFAQSGVKILIEPTSNPYGQQEGNEFQNKCNNEQFQEDGNTQNIGFEKGKLNQISNLVKQENEFQQYSNVIEQQKLTPIYKNLEETSPNTEIFYKQCKQNEKQNVQSFFQKEQSQVLEAFSINQINQENKNKVKNNEILKGLQDEQSNSALIKQEDSKQITKNYISFEEPNFSSYYKNEKFNVKIEEQYPVINKQPNQECISRQIQLNNTLL